MKNYFDRFFEIKESVVNKISDRKHMWIKQLKELKKNINIEIENRLENFYKKRDLVKEALSEKVKFQNKKFLTPIIKYFFPIRLRYLISAPFIYMMIIPAIILDICLEIYHRICFPLYGIKTVRRKDYFVCDRHYLSYLNWFEKLNCSYCSYFNNLIAYTREIAWRTEQYWCPIKNARRRHQPHSYYENFIEYLDGRSYRDNITKIRNLDKK